MDNKLMESYIDKIAELVIDEDKIVTYKSLSTALGVHVNTSKQLLYTFLTNEKSKNSFPISATYLVAGKVVDGSFSINVVNEADLKSARDSLVEVTSEHVYSVQKGKGLKELQVLCETDEESIKSANSKLVITGSNCVLHPIAEEKKRDVCSDSNQKVVAKALLPEKPTIAPKEEKKKVETAEKKESSSKSPKKPSPKGNQQKVQGNTKKTGGNIANLFAKVAQKNATKTATVAKADGNASREAAEVVGEVSAKSVSGDTMEECEQEKAEKFEGRRESKESLERKKKGNERKRIRVFSDSEESDTHEEEEEEDETKREVEDEQSPPRTIDVEDDEEEKEVKEFIPRNKRKKRKVVDKTVMHEDGYLETRKEVVFETDSEDELGEAAAAAPAALKEAQKSKAVNDKGKGVQGVAKKQSSLLSFFKKR